MEKIRLIPWSKNGWIIGLYINPNTQKYSYMIANDNKGVVDYPVKYRDGTYGFDNPCAIPKYVMKAFANITTK